MSTQQPPCATRDDENARKVLLTLLKDADKEYASIFGARVGYDRLTRDVIIALAFEDLGPVDDPLAAREPLQKLVIASVHGPWQAGLLELNALDAVLPHARHVVRSAVAQFPWHTVLLRFARTVHLDLIQSYEYQSDVPAFEAEFINIVVRYEPKRVDADFFL